jgi:hypothetical protein
MVAVLRVPYQALICNGQLDKKRITSGQPKKLINPNVVFAERIFPPPAT